MLNQGETREKRKKLIEALVSYATGTLYSLLKKEKRENGFCDILTVIRSKLAKTMKEKGYAGMTSHPHGSRFNPAVWHFG